MKRVDIRLATAEETFNQLQMELEMLLSMQQEQRVKKYGREVERYER